MWCGNQKKSRNNETLETFGRVTKVSLCLQAFEGDWNRRLIPPLCWKGSGNGF